MHALWGVGPATADRIIRARHKQPMRGEEDLVKIAGIAGATAHLIASEADF